MGGGQVKLPHQPAQRVLVMQNVFHVPPESLGPPPGPPPRAPLLGAGQAPVQVHQVYDLKGSLLKRFVTQEEQDAGESTLKVLRLIPPFKMMTF